MIEAGADAVVGHHPHVAQEVEIIDGRPVLYSLGNGVFHGHPKKSRKIPPERLRSVTADLQFSPAGLQRIILTPYNTNNLKTEYIPRPLSDEEASSFFRRHLKSIKGRWRQEENRAVISLQ
jgi:poly-gamma-glutamate synthesis protein (capsule biosynthesis protein)